MMTTSFLAQAAQQGCAAGIGGMLFPMILVFALFYVMLIRPQQRKEKERLRMIAELREAIANDAFTEWRAQLAATLRPDGVKQSGSCKTFCGMGVPPMKHGQDARATPASKGGCKSPQTQTN